MNIQSVCVFCGAQNAVEETHLQLARDLGKAMAERGLSLVYGGGDCGLMGAVANSMLEAKAHVTGVFPESLRYIEKEHQTLDDIIIVDSMHTRKEIMYKKSDIFVILPGGFGTMDELFEILTWKQLQLHTKPIVILNHEGYWDHLAALMEHIIDSGFAKEEVRQFFKVVNSQEELLEYIAEKQASSENSVAESTLVP